MRILISLCFIITWNTLDAQIITDRPDQTESSSTVPKGALQLESGILISSEGSGNVSSKQYLLPTNLFRYGLSDWLELRLLSQFEISRQPFFLNINSKSGISDFEVGAKIQIMRSGSSNAEIAFLTHLVTPSGSVELTGDTYGTINKLSISHTINESMGIGYNLGYDYFGVGNGNLTYSLALGSSVNEKVGIYLEPYGEITNMDNFVINMDAGFTYLANDNLQLDFSFGLGLNQKMNYISIGASWLITK